MAYRFRKAESVSAGFHRVFREETASAVGQLLKGRNRAEAVHEARKSVKKLRALFALSPAVQLTEDRYFRDIGRKLSPLRDAEAVIEAFDDLAQNHEALATGEFQSVRRNLERLAVETRRALDERNLMKEAAALLKAKHTHEWRLEASSADFVTLLPGFVGAYRGARKAWKKAARKPTDESFHELRKQVKQHWYHLKLIEPFWNHAIEARAHDVRNLETWLGDEHNLTVLRAKLSAEAETARDRQLIQDFLHFSSKEAETLRRRSLELALKLYCAKAAAFGEEFARVLPSAAPAKPNVAVA